MNDGDSFLMSGGVPSYKFQAIGSTVTGAVLDMDYQQQRDFDSNEPLTWEDGNPKMQLRVVLQAQPATEDDDGRRAIYVKGQMRSAVRDAVRESKASTLDAGGVLTVTYAADGAPPRAKLSPPKLYKASYSPPNQSSDFGDEPF